MRDRQRVTKASPTVTVEEYLELDRAADGKLELLDGVVVAMAGASPRHNHIVANGLGELRAALRGGPCFVFSQAQRVRIEATGSYVDRGPEGTVRIVDVSLSLDAIYDRAEELPG
jgi:Uma2 family endonuclease